jgi:hypothetical protein
MQQYKASLVFVLLIHDKVNESWAFLSNQPRISFKQDV